MSASEETPDFVHTVPAGYPAYRMHVLPKEECVVHRDNNKWSKPFYFIQAADTQFGMIANFIRKLPEPRWDEEMALTQQLVDSINDMEPEPAFIVICGDLTDAEPGTEVRKQQVKDLKEVLSRLKLNIPVVCVCGNHDVGNYPTLATLEEYKADFGDDYFYFIYGGVLFIVINSQFYDHRAHVEEYAAQHDKWLDHILSMCPRYKYSILFEHIPLFLRNVYEDDDEYFNVKRQTRFTWLQKFKQAGINKIMCGHYHRNSGGWYGQMEVVITSAVGGQLGNDKSGARIVKVNADRIDHQYYALDDLPKQISL